MDGKYTRDRMVYGLSSSSSATAFFYRIYFTTSLLANWDKGDVPEVEGPPQFFKAYDQVDNDLVLKFTIDFAKEKLGMPHQMRFGAYSLYSKSPDNKNMAELSK